MAAVAYSNGRLTALKIRKLTAPGRYGDGNGLYLVVDRSGAKRWVLRTVVQGRRRDMGLGGARLVSLAGARKAAMEYRFIARDGGDPFAMRRRSRNVAMTFAQAAKRVHAENAASWKNEKHRAQWINTLKSYAFPVIGARPVNQIAPSDILKVLTPIWLTKPETARRLRQRIRAVFDWAKAMGLYEGDNPVDGVAKALPKQTAKPKHHAAVAYAKVPSFIAQLRDYDSEASAKLALEFLTLTASRTSEVLRARWDEFDIANAVWTVPPERMKAGREHRIPLSARALAILREARRIGDGSEFVFPASSRKPLSNMALLMTLRRMGVEATVHGFRSAFRDWAAERTNFPREVCERALAHTITNKAEAAYQCGDLLDKRRTLMDAWSAFAGSIDAKVLPFTGNQARQ
jgi:integrase